MFDKVENRMELGNSGLCILDYYIFNPYSYLPFPLNYQQTPSCTKSTKYDHKSDHTKDIINSPETEERSDTRTQSTVTMYRVWMMKDEDMEYEEEVTVTVSDRNQDENLEAVFRSVERRIKRKVMMMMSEEITVVKKELKVEIVTRKRVLTKYGNDLFEYEEMKLSKEKWKKVNSYPTWKLRTRILPVECELPYVSLL